MAKLKVSDIAVLWTELDHWISGRPKGSPNKERNMGPNVHIEYWYRELASQIKQQVPDANVSGGVGRSSSFEVTVNNKLVYSKLEKKAFPDNREVVRIVKQANGGGQEYSSTAGQGKTSQKRKKNGDCLLL